MKTKSTLSFVLLVLLISLILPLNSFAQRDTKNRIPDDRLKNRLPIREETKPRERPNEKLKENKKKSKTNNKVDLVFIAPPELIRSQTAKIIPE